MAEAKTSDDEAPVSSQGLGPDDANEVFESCKKLSAQWRLIGQKLGLSQYTLDIIEAGNPLNPTLCMASMLHHWLKKDTIKHSVPTWEALCKGLTDVDRHIAEEIAKMHHCKIITGDEPNIPPELFKVCRCGQCTIADWIQSSDQCPKPGWIRYPKVITLDPLKAVKPQTLGRENTLRAETRQLVELYAECSKVTYCALDTEIHYKGLDCKKVIAVLKKHCKWPRMLHVTTEQELFNLFDDHLYVSWFNAKPLFHVAEEFLSSKYPEVIQQWSRYFIQFEQYIMHRRVSEYADILFNDEAAENVFVIEVDEEYEDMKLSDVIFLRDTVCLVLDAPKASVHLVTVRIKSIHLHFLYCLDDYLERFTLTADQMKMLGLATRLHRVISLKDMNDRFKYSFELKTTESTSGSKVSWICEVKPN